MKSAGLELAKDFVCMLASRGNEINKTKTPTGLKSEAGLVGISFFNSLGFQ